MHAYKQTETYTTLHIYTYKYNEKSLSGPNRRRSSVNINFWNDIGNGYGYLEPKWNTGEGKKCQWQSNPYVASLIVFIFVFGCDAVHPLDAWVCTFNSQFMLIASLT